MTDQDFSVAAGFEQGEVSGNLHLGKFEAQYEELFAEVIEDGIITVEERAKLDRAADSLGLDRSRLHRLEQALQAAYEERHQVKITDLSDEAGPVASIQPLAPTTDARTQALERRIHALEARIVQLEADLAEAQSQVAVEIDLGDFAAPAAVSATTKHESVPELLRRLRADPRDHDALHGLFHSHPDTDRKVQAALVLDFLAAATPEEKALLAAHRQDGLIQPKQSLTTDGWRRLLFHPDEEALTGEIFAVIASAVLLGRVSALRRDKALPTLDPARKQDPATSTLQAVRCFSWASSILGMKAPTLYADPNLAGVVEMVPGLPPVSRLGKLALSGRTAPELAFAAGRHLSWYREEHFVRLLVPSIPDLEDLFLAALVIGNPGIPLAAGVKARVTPIAKAIEPILEPVLVDHLRGYFLRFVEEGGRTNLLRWATSADRTAARAGFLLSGDLKASQTMLIAEDAAQAAERLDDVLVFVTSDRHSNLRKQIGIAIALAVAVKNRCSK